MEDWRDKQARLEAELAEKQRTSFVTFSKATDRANPISFAPQLVGAIIKTSPTQTAIWITGITEPFYVTEDYETVLMKVTAAKG
jgi:hypothetical protein